MTNRLITTSLLIAAALLLTSANAAVENRRPDDESSSRLRISLSILPTLSIQSVSDVHFNIERRDIDANYEEYFCIRGTGDTRYSIIAYGSSSSGEVFQLANVDGETLNYAVGYRGDSKSNEYDNLVPGESSPVYEVASNDQACDGKTNFSIAFKAEDLKAAASGLYNGALTLVVAPV